MLPLGESYIHPCINTSSIRITMKDLLEKFQPHVGQEFWTVDLEWQEV